MPISYTTNNTYSNLHYLEENIQRIGLKNLYSWSKRVKELNTTLIDVKPDLEHYRSFGLIALRYTVDETGLIFKEIQTIKTGESNWYSASLLEEKLAKLNLTNKKQRLLDRFHKRLPIYPRVKTIDDIPDDIIEAVTSSNSVWSTIRNSSQFCNFLAPKKEKL